MTDVFNIDRENDGFRKNTLDWRKLHTNYAKLSESKLKRGIKPLPLNLLLKLFGPQKVLSTYVITRQVSNVADYYTAGRTCGEDICAPILDMKDKTVAKTLTFHDVGASLKHSSTDENGMLPNHSLVRPAKHAALPARPVFQKSAHVPGRYFPKPSTSDELSLLMKPVPPDGVPDRPRTRTPRSAYTAQTGCHSRDTSGRAGMSARATGNRNSGLIRGSVCRSTDSHTASARGPAANVRSTDSHTASARGPAANVRSSAPILTPYEPSRTVGQPGPVSGDKLDVFAISFRNDDPEGGSAADGYDPHSELHSDYYTIKRLRMSTRQVSFPKSSGDFTTVLHGRTKTIHPRDMQDVVDAPLTSSLQRSRTHVGFIDRDVT